MLIPNEVGAHLVSVVSPILVNEIGAGAIAHTPPTTKMRLRISRSLRGHHVTVRLFAHARFDVTSSSNNITSFTTVYLLIDAFADMSFFK